MLISHDHKFIFIHIGKAAGTSIELALCDHLGIDFETTKRDESGDWHKHIWARYMKERVGALMWSEYFTFAFVRNPYEMVLSLYSMYTQYPEYTQPVVHPRLYHPWNQYDDFQDFVYSMAARRHEPDDEWRTQLDKIGEKTQMQVWNSLSNLHTSYLTTSWQGREGPGEILVDFVGRYENLEADFHNVCRRIGLPDLELPRRGDTTHAPYEELYDNKMKAFTYDHFAIDFERFGYAAG